MVRGAGMLCKLTLFRLLLSSFFLFFLITKDSWDTKVLARVGVRSEASTYITKMLNSSLLLLENPRREQMCNEHILKVATKLIHLGAHSECLQHSAALGEDVFAVVPVDQHGLQQVGQEIGDVRHRVSCFLKSSEVQQDVEGC